MSYLVANPEDRFSRDEALCIVLYVHFCSGTLWTLLLDRQVVFLGDFPL